MLAVSAITLTSIQYGRLHFAIASGLPVIDRFKNSDSLPPPIMGTVYGSVGLVYYEWNQLDQAHEYFKKSMHLASLVGHNAGLVYSEMIMSRYFLAVGDLPAAERAIQEAARLLEFGVPAWLRPEVTLQQVRLYLIQENAAAAESIIQKYESAAPPHIMIILARLRLLHYYAIKKGSSAANTEGKVLAQKVIDTGLQQQRIGVVLQALLLRAQMGSRSVSAADMTKAIELAEPEGFLRTFLDEGSAIANLLKQHTHSDAHRDYLHKLLSACGETISNHSPIHDLDSGIDALSDRELEVLRLMAQGLKYEEIAGKLVITLNTVRFHVKQIYRKLNANNRTSAIETARKLDLL
jgi:LuxR family transcriptional regulator, maltose regulon positive regulatory protein